MKVKINEYSYGDNIMEAVYTKTINGAGSVILRFQLLLICLFYIMNIQKFLSMKKSNLITDFYIRSIH